MARLVAAPDGYGGHHDDQDDETDNTDDVDDGHGGAGVEDVDRAGGHRHIDGRRADPAGLVEQAPLAAVLNQEGDAGDVDLVDDDVDEAAAVDVDLVGQVLVDEHVDAPDALDEDVLGEASAPVDGQPGGAAETGAVGVILDQVSNGVVEPRAGVCL